MASKGKGITVPIDITLNTKEFVKDVTTASSASGKELERKLTASLNKAEAKLRQFAQAERQLLSTNALPEGMTSGMYKALERSSKAAEKFIDEYNHIQRHANNFDVHKITDEYQKVENKIADVRKEIQNLEAKRSEQQNIKSAIETVKAFRQEKTDISDVAKRYDYLIGREQFLTKVIESRKKAITDATEAARQEYEKRAQVLKSLIQDPRVSRADKTEYKKQLRDLFDEFERVPRLGVDKFPSLEGFETQLRNVKTELESIAPIIEEDRRKTEAYTEANELLYSMGIAPTAKNLKIAEQAINEYTAAISNSQGEILKYRQAQEKMEGDSHYQRFGVSDQKAQELDALVKEFIRLSAAEDDAQKNANRVNRSFEKTKHSGNKLRDVLKKIRSVTHKVIEAFKKLHHHSKRSFDSSTNGIKGALRNIMRYGLGIRSLYFLFRRLRSATKEAFGVMAQQWEPVNEQISSMIKSLNAVKGSLATMLQPLLGTFSAFFNSMMSVLQNIMETIGAFFAALTGQDYILRAHAGDIDWAESLADDLGTAADNAEELNKQLAGFDKINNLTTNKDKDKSGKKDIGLSTVTYEKIPIEKLKIYSWLKEMWDKTDFTELGDFLSKRLAGALEAIDWDKIQDYGKRIGKSIATGLNGFFANKRLAKDIGKSIAKLINTAFQSINSFATNFKWDELGLFIKTGIQSFLNNADTYDWGFSVGNVVTGITTAIYTLVSDPKTWEDLGNKIKDGITGFLNSMSQPREVKVDERVIGHYQGHVITEDITKTMNGWEIAAGALSGFVTGLIDTLNDALGDEANWERFGEGVGQFIANIKWADVFKKIANFAKNILNGIITAVQAAYDADPTIITNALNIGFAIAVTNVAIKTAANMITGMITSKLVEAGILTEGVAGASAGISGAGMLYLAIPVALLLLLHSIDVATDQAAREKFGNEVADEINTIPEETKKALGPACVEGGVADGGWAFKIATRISMLVTTDDEGKPEGWTTKLGNYLTDKKKNPLGARIIEWFSSSMKDSQSDMTTQAETSINTALSDVNIDSTALESQSGDLGKNIKSGFNNEFINDTELSGPNSPMQKAFQKGVDGVKDDVYDINSPSKVFKEIGEFVIEGFLLPFKDLPDLFKKVWITAQNASVASINRMRVVVSNALNTVAGNIKAIMQTMLSNIGNSLGSIVDSVKSKLKGALESSISFSGITNSLSTVNKQWENMWSDMAETTKKKANSIIDSMNGMLKGLEILANTNADGTLTTGKTAKTFPRIPHLAQGAVIPPNKQFLAVLGDQKQGTNVEAPVSVIEDAVGRALKKYGVNVTFDVQGDPNGMFKVMQRKSNEFNRRTGLPSFT